MLMLIFLLCKNNKDLFKEICKNNKSILLKVFKISLFYSSRSLEETGENLIYL